MSDQYPIPMDPTLDLVLERVVNIPPELVWQSWTSPEHLKQWFCPRPWSVAECEIDLRPGGRFRTVMRSPEGELLPEGDGCYLEVVQNRRLVWTSALRAGYRPQARTKDDVFLFTAYVLMEPEGKGTRYTVIAMHQDPAGRAKHKEMGFAEGWGKALDQLVELMQSQAH